MSGEGRIKLIYPLQLLSLLLSCYETRSVPDTRKTTKRSLPLTCMPPYIYLKFSFIPTEPSILAGEKGQKKLTGNAV